MNKVIVKKVDNKVPLYLIPLKEARTATVLFMFKTGSKYETKENSGISHFLEHLFFKGTKKRPDTATISSELDSLGCEFNAFTSKEFTGYYIKVASNKMAAAIKVLGDMLLNSNFAQEEIERERGVIIEELKMYEDNPLRHIGDVFESCLYGDTPAGWDTIGTKKNILKFSREDFIDYYSQQYGSNSLSVILAGQLRTKDKDVLEKIIKQFKDNPWKNKLKVKEEQKKPKVLALFKPVDQVAMSLGLRTVPVSHPLALKLKLLALVLGGSMSSRLFIKLRERNGLAYYVRTFNEGYSDSGYLTTQAGVPKDKLKDAIKIILEEYQRVKKELINDKELKKVKDLLAGRMALKLEATDEVASWYAEQIVLGDKILSPAETLKEINNITAQDLQKVAKKFFVEKNLNLAVIGRLKDQKLSSILRLK